MSPVLSSSVGTFALLAEPDAAHNSLGYLTVQNGAAEAYVYFPITGIPTGATLTSALITLYASGSWGVTPTLTAQATDAGWAASQVTWNTHPTASGAVTTVTHASAVDGDPWVFDVTAQVNTQRAAGTAYGFVVKRTDALASKALYSQRDSTRPPSLTLVWTTTPKPPSSVSPSGGRAVATSKPTIRLNGASGAVQVQVQVDATAGAFTSPEFDSGWVTVTGPSLDLATTAYAGAASATDKTVRAQYRTTVGGPASGWSPVSHWMYRAYAVVTITYPDTTGLVTTDTPTITWTLSAGTQTAYEVSLSLTATPLVVDHRKVGVGTTLSYTIPSQVITDSSAKTVTVSVTDAYDREAVAGYPTAATATQPLVFHGTLALLGVD